MDLISFNIFYIHWYCKLEGHFCQTPHLTPAAAGQASSKRWAWKLLTTNSPESWKPFLCRFFFDASKSWRTNTPIKLLSTLNKLLCLCFSDCFALLHFSTLSKWCPCLLPRYHFFIRQVQWDIASAVTLPWIRAAAEALLHDTRVASRRGYKEFTAQGRLTKSIGDCVILRHSPWCISVSYVEETDEKQTKVQSLKEFQLKWHILYAWKEGPNEKNINSMRAWVLNSRIKHTSHRKFH